MLDIKTNGTHEFERVAALRYAGREPKVKTKLAIFEAVFKMEIRGGRWQLPGHLGEREVVGSNQAQRAASEQALYKRLRAGTAIIGIGAAEQFVEQEQDRRGLFGEFGNQFQAQNFGVETGNAALQRIQNTDRCGYLKRGETKLTSADRRTAMCKDRVEADGSDQRAFSRHVGAADDHQAQIAAKMQSVTDGLSAREQRMRQTVGCEGRAVVDEFWK